MQVTKNTIANIPLLGFIYVVLSIPIFSMFEPLIDTSDDIVSLGKDC